MKIHIVCYEDVHQWILGKFALRMHDELVKLGIESDISKEEDATADVNHHIIYVNYKPVISNINTLMVTHIDDSFRLKLLKNHLEIADLGICMSKETMDKLTALGIPEEKLAYVNPAQDGVIKHRKICIGITCGVQDDGRKREHFIESLSEDLDPSLFRFKIMGFGWTKYYKKLLTKGFEVEYDEKFNYEKYLELIPSLDYYLYTGQDEGQMGFLDALNAGVKTIVTPQGYHLDAVNGISYSFNTYDELLSIFMSIADEKLKLINSVKDWTWSEYTLKHVKLWEYLIHKKSGVAYTLPSDKKYNDGVYSLIDKRDDNKFHFDSKTEIKKLKQEYVRHLYYKIKNRAVKMLSKS